MQAGTKSRPRGRSTPSATTLFEGADDQVLRPYHARHEPCMVRFLDGGPLDVAG